MKATPFNQKTIAEFHDKKGRGVGMWGDHVLLMTAKGAKSGDAITTPLVYGREGDDYIVVASKGGAPKHPTWFGNITANPQVEVEVANATEPKNSKPAPGWWIAVPSATGCTPTCRRSGRPLPTTRPERTVSFRWLFSSAFPNAPALRRGTAREEDPCPFPRKGAGHGPANGAAAVDDGDFLVEQHVTESPKATLELLPGV